MLHKVLNKTKPTADNQAVGLFSCTPDENTKYDFPRNIIKYELFIIC